MYQGRPSHSRAPPRRCAERPLAHTSQCASGMNTATKNDALRKALILAGQHLAATNIHGRFRLTRRPNAVTVTFAGNGKQHADRR